MNIKLRNFISISKNKCEMPYTVIMLLYIFYILKITKISNEVEGYETIIKNLQILNCINLLKDNYKDINLTLNRNVLGLKSESIFELSYPLINANVYIMIPARMGHKDLNKPIAKINNREMIKILDKYKSE